MCKDYFMTHYGQSIGITTSILAELWEIRDGLSMCLDLRIYALIVESDAKVFVDLINNDSLSIATNASLVADCRLLLSQIPQVKVVHCFREANCCADANARIGTFQDSDIFYYNSPPPVLLNSFLSDLYGLGHTRICPDLDVVAAFV